ncbi:Integrase, catalytic region [Desulforamulus reducens MI-1]|uniref:Integrase, catalytic region n=1 Tax=Desulforamulus reducens (strain ATCC BAA-1160 / DSM 100696 / MI-1) TaxID=349161 RepID=A4J416_DESRM|nr:IS481 family transposase [Desulforamulus reducens]ABO49819.1 Integrase, catalytic region [Desulforamulus reducens MI-1]ABO50769.1 Integrase, catalytic region [Desulforamulus reducens MI-1]
MLTAKDRESIALKKFSLISPVLNGQVKNQKDYFETICVKPIDMPYYGFRMYSPKTLMCWLSDYRRGGLDSLKPGYRSDKGKSRKVSLEIADEIRKKRSQMPRITSALLYEELVKDKVILPEKLSRATFYRFLVANPELAAGKDPENPGEKELKRFSHQRINELWQTDIMFGPYISIGKSKKQAYLIAFIDDASRLITHAQFFFFQNFVALRVALKEAVLKRGIPKMIYTDNGKVYRSDQLNMLCAGLGCSLIHTEPFTPTSKGKIERFFHTVRQRFLSRLDPTKLKSLDQLNLYFWQWLEEDYQRKTHSALNMSPLDFFMAQVHNINFLANPQLLEEHFLLLVTRKVNHDATLSVESILYETEQSLANSRLEVRYDPDWLANSNQPILLYRDGMKVGEARQVNFFDNARAKRKGRGRQSQSSQELLESVETSEQKATPSISYAQIDDQLKQSSREVGDR